MRTRASVIGIFLYIITQDVTTTDVQDFIRTAGEVNSEVHHHLGYDEPVLQSSARDQRFLMNVGGIFGEPLCKAAGSSLPTGVCRNELACVQKGGTLILPNTCEFLQGHCCEYHNECGSTSSQRVVYWQSHGYPSQTETSGTCRFELEPGADVCYIKIEFLDVILDSQIPGQCMANVLYILNMDEGNGSPVCGALGGFEMFVKVKYRDTLKLATNAVPVKLFINMKTSPYKFRIRLTQIRCDQVKPFPDTRKRRDSHNIFKRNIHAIRNVRDARREENYEIPISSEVLKRVQHQSTDRKKNRKQKCVNDDKFRRVSPADSELFHPSLRQNNVFANIIENDINEIGFLPNTRIAGPGGVAITDVTAEFPWLGYMLLKNEFQSPYFCGAILISSKYALTSAHCVTKKGYTSTNYDIRVRFGRTDLGGAPVTSTVLTTLFEDPEAVKVTRTVVHAMFDYITLQYDAAIMELAEEVLYMPVKLPTAGNSYEGLTGKILGWGFTGINSGLSQTPNHLDVNILSNEVCNEIWKVKSSAYTYTYPDYIQPDMVCTKSTADNEGQCAGDSGGPLVILGSGSYTLVGILSGVFFTCITSGSGTGVIGEYPDISTRVSELLDFISVATSSPF